MKVSGTHALVTGGSHGIGVDIARELTSRGARVTVLGRNAGRLAEVAAEVGGGFVVIDLADTKAVARAMASIEAEHGDIDVLVNNAGHAQVVPVPRSAAGDADRLMSINATAPMELIRQALPGMIQRGLGHVVNISSLAGVSAVPDMAVYGASKAALHHYTAGVQRELRHRGDPVGMTLITLGEVSGTLMMEEARRSPIIAAISERLARTHALPELSTAHVARKIVDAVERDALYATIPRRVGGMVALRNLPSRIQDLTLIGLHTVEARGSTRKG